MNTELIIRDGILIIPDGVTDIPEGAFSDCEELSELRIPGSVRTIGAAAFAGCTGLRSVTFSEGLAILGEGAFLGCSSLTEAVLPESLREIREMAFWESGLERVRIPAGVCEIGDSAFWCCEELTLIEVAGADTRIGANAFGSCYGLIEGYVAPGYPENADPPAMLLYTLLWCSCPGRHGDAVSRRAEEYIKRSEELIMSRIVDAEGTAALAGLVSRRLLGPACIDKYIRVTAERGLPEMTALLLRARSTTPDDGGDFEL